MKLAALNEWQFAEYTHILGNYSEVRILAATYPLH